MKVLIVDNYDSFTYNLYQFIGEILSSKEVGKFELLVKRNNEINLDEVKALCPDRIVISPGPGNPENEAYFGVCAKIIRELGCYTPILGVCLGMQGIAHAFGGNIVKALLPMHGKLSPIVHNNKNVFHNIPQDLNIMRYHSLVAEHKSLPECLELTAYIADGESFAPELKPSMEIMGVRHKQFPIYGIQFHPESFASEGGKEMIENFLFEGVSKE